MITRAKKAEIHPGLYSITRNTEQVAERTDKGLNVLLDRGDLCTLYLSAGETVRTTTVPVYKDSMQKRILERCDDGDVVEINEYGTMQIRYARKEGDYTIYTSAQCNSNCIMCPIGEAQRKTEDLEETETLLNSLCYIPSNVEHITITGGEPFLLGEDIFRILSHLKMNYADAEILLLTNGRVFADKKYAYLYAENRPDACIAGIPIHGSTAEKHDTITQTNGSFLQTIIGIKRLLSLGERVEIRIVVSKLNLEDITGIAEMIVQEIPKTTDVKIMGLEMLGNAALHCENVWVEYGRAMKASEDAIKILMAHGIDVELYNFPLCVVGRKYWGIYRKSIDPYKIRYLENCEECKEKKNCGGFFAGTIRMIDRVNPIRKNTVI